MHALGPCGSLQRTLLWEFVLLLPQPSQGFSIRGLRLYFPALESWVARSASLPAVSGLSVHECGATGSASGQTACPIGPTLCQSRSRHGHVSPLCPGCPSLPLLPVWMNVCFLFPWCRTSLPFDSLSVLVVRGGAVCLPTPPSWFSIYSLTVLEWKPGQLGRDYLVASTWRVIVKVSPESRNQSAQEAQSGEG